MCNAAARHHGCRHTISLRRLAHRTAHIWDCAIDRGNDGVDAAAMPTALKTRSAAAVVRSSSRKDRTPSARLPNRPVSGIVYDCAVRRSRRDDREAENAGVQDTRQDSRHSSH